MWWRVASVSRSIVTSSRSSSANQAAYRLNICKIFTTEILTRAKDGRPSTVKTPFVAFALGGPGSGKGTQCTKIVETFGFTHLSAGDLLRHAISSNYENSAMILDTYKEGKIVPSEVTVKLIQRAIESSDNYKLLIEGFPRSEENRIAFEKIVTELQGQLQTERDLRATMEARLNKPLLRSSISPNIDNKGHIYASAVHARSCITTDVLVLDKCKRDRLTISGYAESSNGGVLCWFMSHIYIPVLPHSEPIIDTNFSEFRGIIHGMSVALGLDMIRYDLRCDNKVVVKNINYAFCKFIKSRCITSSISKTNFKFHQPIKRMLTSYSTTGIFPMIGRIQGGQNRCAEFLSRFVAPYHCGGRVYPLVVFGPPMPPEAYKWLSETPKPWCR